MAPLTNDQNQLNLITFSPDEYVLVNPTVSETFFIEVKNNEPCDVLVKFKFSAKKLVSCQPNEAVVASRECMTFRITTNALDVSLGTKFHKFTIRCVGIREIEDRPRPTAEEVWNNPALWEAFTCTYTHTKIVHIIYSGMNKAEWWKRDGMSPITWGIEHTDLPDAGHGAYH